MAHDQEPNELRD